MLSCDLFCATPKMSQIPETGISAGAEVQQSLQASKTYRFLLDGRHGAPLVWGGCFVGKASFSACRQQPVAAKVRAMAAFQTDCSHASHLLGSGGYDSNVENFCKEQFSNECYGGFSAVRALVLSGTERRIFEYHDPGCQGASQRPANSPHCSLRVFKPPWSRRTFW